jgi:hypothetical protein
MKFEGDASKRADLLAPHVVGFVNVIEIDDRLDATNRV